jgi:hypothetical protein
LTRVPTLRASASVVAITLASDLDLSHNF